ncbi:MAG: aspartate--tRNA(Asn) ligase [Candidatus Pacearchaeota archaeon]|nr:aspartate--tRNA(Asn) ligase [Candidatus Pacearchaeota archaeon]
MQKRIEIAEIKTGKVFLKGWIHELRDLGKIKFLLLRDSSGIVQCVVKEEKLFEKFSNLTLESVVAIGGIVRKSRIKSKEVTKKDIEIEVKKIDLLSKAEPLPISLKQEIKTGLAKRLDFRPIDLRKRRNTAIFKIQSALIEGMQKWLEDNGFVHVFTPCIIGSGSESGAEVFCVDYFGSKAFLRQDPQLHRQLCIIAGFEKIYDLGPNWRAEKSDTTKHLTEHRCMAVEIAFIRTEQDIMRIEEKIILAGIKNVLKKCSEELGLLGVKLRTPKIPFPEIRFPKIYQILEKLGKRIEEGKDLDAESEKLLSSYVEKKYKTSFFFVNGFPFEVKPFYVYHDTKYARSVDLYFRNIELSSGGQREHRYEILMKNIKEKKLGEKQLEWFTQFFKYGVPPHGGFAIGIERLTQALLGLENIREACLFPRDMERILP